MSDEQRVRAWLQEGMPRLDDMPIEPPLSGREVRLRGTGRRRRRTLAAAFVAVGVTVLGAAVCWNAVRPDRGVVAPARPAESSGTQRAQEKLRSYYSALPDAFTPRRSASKLSKLMAVNFTAEALKEETTRESRGSGSLAATCGPVRADTAFTVGGLRRVDGDTVRARVVSSSGPETVEVEFDLRAMKISKWSCGTR